MLLSKPYLTTGLLLFLTAGTFAQRQDGTNEITFPNVPNQSFHYLDTVDVAYETDYATPWMYLFCNQSGVLQEIVYYSPSDVAGRTSIASTLKYDYMPQAQCWFNLRSAQRDANDLNTEQGATSPGFTYNKTEDGSATYALSTTVASTTSTASSSTTTPQSTDVAPTVTTTVTAPSSEPTDASDSASSSGLSTGAKAGIGIGVAAAVIVIVLAASWLWMQRRRKAVPENITPNTDHSYIVDPSEKTHVSSPNTFQSHELAGSGKLPAQHGPYELDPGMNHPELP